MNYILVSVTEREIAVQKFDTYAEVFKRMSDEYNECVKVVDGEFGEWSAWANADNGDLNCDWKIFDCSQMK